MTDHAEEASRDLIAKVMGLRKFVDKSMAVTRVYFDVLDRHGLLEEAFAELEKRGIASRTRAL